MLKSRVLEPIVGEIRQGVNPGAIALSIAFGVVLGLFPVLGVTTFLCFAAAFLLRLNHVAVQAVNYAVYPLQIALLLPFMRMGEALFGHEPMPLTLDEVRDTFAAGWFSALREFSEQALLAVGAWGVAALPLGAAVFLTAIPLLKRAHRNAA